MPPTLNDGKPASESGDQIFQTSLIYGAMSAMGAFILTTNPENSAYTALATFTSMAISMKANLSTKVKVAVVLAGTAGAFGASALDVLPRIPGVSHVPQVSDFVKPITPLSPLKFD